MSALPKYWNQLSTLDFKSLDPRTAVAVLPLAATEQHGPHLPLSVDTEIIDAVVKEGLKHLQPQEPVFVLPTLSVGFSTEHTAFPGTLSLSAQTVLQIGAELGACVAVSGVKKLLLLNSHGGNVGLMDLIARDLRGKHSLMVFSTSWYQLPLSDEAWSGFSDHERRFGVHAGDIETSLMLHIAPERVNMSKAKDFPSSSEQRSRDFKILGDGKSTKLGWHIQDYNESGAVGRANAATPDKGARLLNSAGEQLGYLLKELIKIAPISA
jgi:creatinine amidohydrolase